jgi:hypothetical protein
MRYPVACGVVTDRTFGSAELFDQTSTVRFDPNDRTFFRGTQNFFSLLYIAFYKMTTLDISSLAFVNSIIISVLTAQKRQKTKIQFEGTTFKNILLVRSGVPT